MGELSKQYEGRVEFTIASAKTPEGQEAVKKYELDARKHGLVVLDGKGNVAARIPGHNFGKEEIQAVVEELLK